jgi:hypothetical protein
MDGLLREDSRLAAAPHYGFAYGGRSIALHPPARLMSFANSPSHRAA